MGYTELVSISEALELVEDGRTGELNFERDGRRVTVALEVSSGSVVGLLVKIHDHDWPRITFRREKKSDKASKDSGMNVEVQTGDFAFDELVYIESAYGQDVLGPFLADAKLRAAIMKPIADFDRQLVFTANGLTVKAKLDFLAVDRFVPLFESLLALARIFPSLPAGAKPGPERGVILMVASWLGFLASGLWPLLMMPFGDPVTWSLRWVGLGLGLVAGVGAVPVVRAYTRGHSRSTHFFYGTSLALVPTLPLAFMSAAVFFNAALDRSPAEDLSGVVDEFLGWAGEDDQNARVVVKWNSGTLEKLDVPSTGRSGVGKGDRLHATRRSGALGFPWWERRPALDKKR